MGEPLLNVSAPQFTKEGDWYRVSATLTGAGIDEEIWFRSQRPFSDSGLAPLAFLALALLPAMRLGVRLKVDAAVPREVLEGIERLQAIRSQWHEELRPVEVVAESQSSPVSGNGSQKADGFGFFFTGGVDSFHTYIRHRDAITYALYLHGADILLSEEEHRTVVAEKLSDAAGEMGVKFIEVESNMRDFSDRYCCWGKEFHGVGLVATAMLFAGEIGKVAIASSDPFYRAPPWGSHALTDSLWSTDRLEIVHDGIESQRYEKVVAISKSDLALKYLRVCGCNEPGVYNCCRCEKCLRTMVSLRLAGALDRCPAFHEPLDLARVAALRLTRASEREEWYWNQLALRAIDDPECAEAMEAMELGSRREETVKAFVRSRDAILASPEWARRVPKVRHKLLENLRASDGQWFEERLAREMDARPELAFAVLWGRHRKLLKRRLRDAERGRFRGRCLSALRRIGIGRRTKRSGTAAR